MYNGEIIRKYPHNPHVYPQRKSLHKIKSYLFRDR